MALVAAERETIIILCDADKIATISTHQRPVVTKMQKLVTNGNAKLIEDLTVGKQVGGVYEVPANMITIRNPKPKVATKKRSEGRRNKNVQLCSETTLAGKPCQMIANAETGKCFKHST